MTKFHFPDAIVETEWLEAHLDDPAMRIFDCTTHLLYDEVPPGQPYRVRSGREDFDRGHIPGAGFLDLQSELSTSDSPYSFTLPSAEHFSSAMAQHGVGRGVRVVLYSSTSSMWATRVWWMLRAFGFDDAAVLNGGFRKWVAEGRAVSTAAPPSSRPAKFDFEPRPRLFTGKDEILNSIAAPRVCTVNALPPDLYRGENPRYGRRGRIPASVNVPASDLVNPKDGTFRGPDEVAGLMEPVCGADKSARVIVYCGGGIAATLDAFLLHQLGYENVAVYDNSMSEWATDESLPIEVG